MYLMIALMLLCTSIYFHVLLLMEGDANLVHLFFSQSLIPELRQLRETIRGKKCEVHVSSIMGKCE